MRARLYLFILTASATVSLWSAIHFEAGAADDLSAARSENDDKIIAIDVLLEPDAKMASAAIAANARLRGNYPAGYTLGTAQVPHITLVQRYVREKDLPAMNAAVAKVCERANPLDWTLQAVGIGNGVWSGLAIAYINVERTNALDQFQVDIVKAVEPFAVTGGTADAFAKNKELPNIQADIVEYVETFVPKASGEKFNPHVTFGVAHVNFVNSMKAEPFEKFSFMPRGVAAYQLGNYGTVQNKLWEWKPPARPQNQ
jgi:hypothetical protein